MLQEEYRNKVKLMRKKSAKNVLCFNISLHHKCSRVGTYCVYCIAYPQECLKMTVLCPYLPPPTLLSRENGKNPLTESLLIWRAFLLDVHQAGK